MRIVLCALCAVILIASCRRDNVDRPKPPVDPTLKRTESRNTSGVLTRISYYNEFGITVDTTFKIGTREAASSYYYTYNSKGRLVRMENFIQLLLPDSYYWAFSFEYLNDGLPSVTYRYLKGTQVARNQYFYNSSKQLILDSTYHTPNYGTFTYLKKYEYDGSGRVKSTLELNDKRDTTTYTSYEYFPNKTEWTALSIDYTINFRSVGKVVQEYDAAGKIISEKTYDGMTAQLYSQIDYTYDGASRLLSKKTTTGANSQEERYTYNAVTGKTEKLEYYSNNQLILTTTYFYE